MKKGRGVECFMTVPGNLITRRRVMKFKFRKLIIYTLIISFVTAVVSHASPYNSNTDWMSGKYGITQCFQGKYADGSGMSREEFDNMLNAIDVDAIADQVAASGASWYIVHALKGPFVPTANATLDAYRPTADLTAERDLVMDLYDAITAKVPDIKFGIYLAAGFGGASKATKTALGWEVEVGPTPTYRTRYSEVIQDISDRFGDKISLWWIDSLNDKNRFPDVRVDDSYAVAFYNACKHGNPDALVAQNNGASVTYDPDYIDRSWCDYTAGHKLMAGDDRLPTDGRWVDDGIQWHAATFLGNNWQKDNLRQSEVWWADYVDIVVSGGGSVTMWTGNGRYDPGYDDPSFDGTMRDEQLSALIAIKNAVNGTHYRYECESLSKTATDTKTNVADSGSSEGKFNKILNDAVDDYVEYTVNVPQAGTYEIAVRNRTAGGNGIYQLSVDSTDVGSPVDQYKSPASYSTSTIGTVTFAEAGDKTFRFTVTGKNANSRSYKLAFDYIELTFVPPAKYEFESLPVTATDTQSNITGKNKGHCFSLVFQKGPLEATASFQTEPCLRTSVNNECSREMYH